MEDFLNKKINSHLSIDHIIEISKNHKVFKKQIQIDTLLLIIFEIETMMKIQYHVIALNDDFKVVITTRRKEGILEIAHPRRIPTEPPTLLNSI